MTWVSWHQKDKATMNLNETKKMMIWQRHQLDHMQSIVPRSRQITTPASHPIFRPHHSTTYVDAVYCYLLSSMVCRSVTLVSSAKMAEPIEMPLGVRTLVGPGNHVLDGGPDRPWEEAIYSGSGASLCKVRRWCCLMSNYFDHFFTGQMLFLKPDQQCQGTEGNKSKID